MEPRSREEIKTAHVECGMGRGFECVQVGEEDIDVGDDECETGSTGGVDEGGRRSGCGFDPFEIARRSSRRCWKERERADFGVACWFCEKKDHRTFEVVSVVSETTQGASAVVGIPGIPAVVA